MKSIQDLGALLRSRDPQLRVKFDEPLSRHTSFKIGGPAAVMAFPADEGQLACILQAAREAGIRPVILGAGTNVLAPDQGLDALVICTKGAMTGLKRLTQTQIEAGSGESLAALAGFARSLGLSGLEFAQGIPGSVGGGVFMNAGAYGGELSQTAAETDVMDPDGTVRTVRGEEHAFGYRTSVFEKQPWIILRTRFTLHPAPEEQICRTMQELAERRRASQPLDLPSAGSTFKRPKTGYAAALIQEAGLKGLRVGGAQVSEKHAGFLVNRGGATAEDVKALMELVRQRVADDSGVWLEPEVRFL